jgi:hypothetical protein
MQVLRVSRAAAIGAVVVLTCAQGGSFAQAPLLDDIEQLLTIDHYVGVQSVVPATQTSKLLQGESGIWKLNVPKSTFDPGPAPRTQTMTREAVEGGVKITIKGIDSQGKPFEQQNTNSRDGKDYPSRGNPSYDTVSTKRLDDFTLESTRKKSGNVVQTNKVVVSRDGKVLTATITGTDDQGRRVKNLAVYEKQ